MFCNIDHKNIITSLSKEEMLDLDHRIVAISNKNPPNDSSVTKYINQLLNKSSNDLFTSSISLFKSHSIKKTITKGEGKSLFAFLVGSSSFQGNLFSFTQEKVESLGKMLMYSYKKLISKSQIKSLSSFTSAYEAITHDRINIKKRYQEYNKKYGSISLISFMKKFREDKDNGKYLPPEMIFVINIMKKISKLKFELVNFDQNTFDYFLMILINVKWIFPAFYDIDIVITNDSLLKALHLRYEKELLIEDIKHNKAIKRVNYAKGVFFKRPQFNYAANYVNVTEDAFANELGMGMGMGMGIGINMGTNNNNNSVIESNRLTSFMFKDNMLNRNSIQIPNIRMPILTTPLNHITTTTYSNNNSSNSNPNQFSHYSDIISFYSLAFEYMIVLSHFITQWRQITTLSLSFSESFEKEIQKSMSKKYSIDFKNYHFFTSFLKLLQLTELNMEFNSLDFELFERLLTLIKINNHLTTLRLNLFLSEPHYYPASLFKLYQNLESNLKITVKTESTSNKKLIDNEDIDYLIADHLSDKFNHHIKLLFWELKWLVLTELCLIIRSPDIVNLNEKYSMIVLKLIMNILLYLNSSICQYGTIKLIAPFIQMDTRHSSDIEDFFEFIDLNKNNQSLRSLSLQLQLYDIVHVNHILTEKLYSVYIGDFNQKSLHCFIEALNQNAFRRRCKLQMISIGILPIVTKYRDVERELVMLCNLMMPLLSSIEIRSNLCFECEEYNRFIDSIDNCFVKHFLFEFNHKSKDAICSMSIFTTTDNTTGIYYFDYYTIVERVNEYVKFNSEVRKRILMYLLVRKEAIVTIIYK